MSENDILKINFNESQFGTSPAAIAAMREVVGQVNRYPEPFSASLRTALGRFYGFGEDGLEHVVVAAGASGVLTVIGRALVSPGDEVVTCDPTFGAYEGLARANGGKTVLLPVTEGEVFDLAAMRAAISERTKLVCVCNPNNPTGTLVDHAELVDLIHGLPEGVVALVDEAYLEFADDEPGQTVMPEVLAGYPVIVVRTFSKIYGMAGARVGYAVSTKEITEKLAHKVPVFAAAREGLAGAIAALADQDYVAHTRQKVAESRAFLTGELEARGWHVYPSQTNFIYADSHRDTAALAKALRARGVLIRGDYEYSRITLGTIEEDKRLLATIDEAIGAGEVPSR